MLNWLGGEDKPVRKLLLAVQEVRLIIEPAAAARRGPCGRGRPDSFDGWFENNLPTMPPLPAPPKKATPKKVAMPWSRAFVSTGPSCIAARPPPAARTAGQAASSA